MVLDIAHMYEREIERTAASAVKAATDPLRLEIGVLKFEKSEYTDLYNKERRQSLFHKKSFPWLEGGLSVLFFALGIVAAK